MGDKNAAALKGWVQRTIAEMLLMDVSERVRAYVVDGWMGGDHGGSTHLPIELIHRPTDNSIQSSHTKHVQVGQAEELASCLLAMPVGSARQDQEVTQFLQDMLGSTPVRFTFGYVDLFGC